MSLERLGSSFRDPSGFVFHLDGRLYRQVSESYREDYDRLMASGLYQALIADELIIPHDEVDAKILPDRLSSATYKILEPQTVPYISYPYEWCFSQLKDAAFLTLQIQKKAMKFGMSLKDASAYNVQFIGSRAVFIDSLSFEKYDETQPWVAYRQYCQHFLAPLALMAHRDFRLHHLLRDYIDGVPLELASRLLPRRSYCRFGLLAHIHLHASSQRRHHDDARDKAVSSKGPGMSKSRLAALLSSLENAVSKCRAPNVETEWGDYYDDTNYSRDSMTAKEKLVQAMAQEYFQESIQVHDLGANTGVFSRLVADDRRYVVAHDIDELAVERHYVANKAHSLRNILPLILDLNNPSPGLGWANRERDSFVDRVRGSAVLALALIHHLAISNNVPLASLADFFHSVADSLIIEFVPKRDSQVQRLLRTREDIFSAYDEANFEAEFEKFFKILGQSNVEGTYRTLYAMRRR